MVLTVDNAKNGYYCKECMTKEEERNKAKETDLNTLQGVILWEVEFNDGVFKFTREQLAKFVLEQRKFGVEEYMKLTLEKVRATMQMKVEA